MSDSEKTRSQQLCEDTLATMFIANDMVLVMFRHFEETLKHQREEIEQLTNQVRELNQLLADAKSDPTGRPDANARPNIVSETQVMSTAPLLDPALE